MAQREHLIERRWRLPDVGHSAAQGLLVAGSLLALATTVSLALQPRLSRTPPRADDETQLIVVDLVRAQAMLDLYGTCFTTAIMATWLLVWVPDRSWWLVTAWGLPLVVTIVVTRRFARSPSVPPVAAHVLARDAVEAT